MLVRALGKSFTVLTISGPLRSSITQKCHSFLCAGTSTTDYTRQQQSSSGHDNKGQVGQSPRRSNFTPIGQSTRLDFEPVKQTTRSNFTPISITTQSRSHPKPEVEGKKPESEGKKNLKKTEKKPSPARKTRKVLKSAKVPPKPLNRAERKIRKETRTLEKISQRVRNRKLIRRSIAIRDGKLKEDEEGAKISPCLESKLESVKRAAIIPSHIGSKLWFKPEGRSVPNVHFLSFRFKSSDNNSIVTMEDFNAYQNFENKINIPFQQFVEVIETIKSIDTAFRLRDSEKQRRRKARIAATTTTKSEEPKAGVTEGKRELKKLFKPISKVDQLLNVNELNAVQTKETSKDDAIKESTDLNETAKQETVSKKTDLLKNKGSRPRRIAINLKEPIMFERTIPKVGKFGKITVSLHRNYPGKSSGPIFLQIRRNGREGRRGGDQMLIKWHDINLYSKKHIIPLLKLHEVDKKLLKLLPALYNATKLIEPEDTWKEKMRLIRMKLNARRLRKARRIGEANYILMKMRQMRLGKAAEEVDKAPKKTGKATQKSKQYEEGKKRMVRMKSKYTIVKN